MNPPNDNLSGLAAAPDPRLEALLDEALRPEAPPPGLTGRIVARTAALLPSAHAGVLARIDHLYRWPRAVAAAMVVAASLGIALSATQIVRAAHTLVAVDRGLAALPAYHADPEAGFDGGPTTRPDTGLRQCRNALRDTQEDLERGLAHIEQQAEDEDHG